MAARRHAPRSSRPFQTRVEEEGGCPEVSGPDPRGGRREDIRITQAPSGKRKAPGHDVWIAQSTTEELICVVTHLVLFKPRPDLTHAERLDFAAAFERAVSEISSVRGARIGRRVAIGAGYEASAPDVADYVALLEFDDRAGLREYLDHPAHIELGRLFRQSLAAAMVYDFEIGDLELLWSLV